MKGAEWGHFQKQKDIYVFHVLLRLHEPFFYVNLNHSLCVLPNLPPCSEPPQTVTSPDLLMLVLSSD